MTERSPSGLWRIFSPSPSSPKPSSPTRPPSGSHPSAPRPPSGSQPAVKPPSGSYGAVPPGGAYTGSTSSITRGLPPEPKGKAEMLLQQAMVNCEHGAWAAAETNLRLALTFDPSDKVVKRKLEEVIATRETQRKAAQGVHR